MTPKLSSNITAGQLPPHHTPSQQYSTSPSSTQDIEGSVPQDTDGDNGQAHAARLMSQSSVKVSPESPSAQSLEAPGSSTAAAPALRLSPPPRGRSKLYCDISALPSPSHRENLDESARDSSCKSMPMPARPQKRCLSIFGNPISNTAAPSKKDTRPKAYLPEVPVIAPRYSPNSHGDFFPWTGNHPEDQFSESSIRQGFIDKTQTTQNETGSARSLLHPVLKHKSGIQTLSSVFTSILAQRRTNGQITLASTFKPPPRVTVTDTKREMWLKDLANPTISLRRLSRSIPHGIRGRILLDQSLSKNIPVERAVWLARCVGANELRSYRRKGAGGTCAKGGEAKWIRDFTVCVEQFLESIIGTCGDVDFKSKIYYAIRLATIFHAESLLDREHYMEWLVSSLENTSQVRLPLWLLVVQIYWKELLQYRKYGRRLSCALLDQLAEANDHPDSDLLAPLAERVTSLLKELILWNNNNFVAPSTWAKHRDLIYSRIGANDEHSLSIIKSIDARNSRLHIFDYPKPFTSQHCLVKILDKCFTTPYTNAVAYKCWEAEKEKNYLIRTVLDWSTSSYRPGKTKIYVGARLLRLWEKNSSDITESVLNFLDSTTCETGRNKADFYHLISELSRSGHFSTPKYIQWMIARGEMPNSQTIRFDGPCASRLLAELPRTNLSESISEIRMNLLNRANFLDDEDNYVKRCQLLICRELPSMQTDFDLNKDAASDSTEETENFISNVSRTVKSEIGLWLRKKVIQKMAGQQYNPMGKWNEFSTQTQTQIPASTITLSNFHIIRGYLEKIGDFSILADVLKLVSSSNDIEILASCADTLNLHLEKFSAIGGLTELFNILLSRLRAMTDQSSSCPRAFLVALVGLSSRQAEKASTTRDLKLELSRSNKRSGIDACSPISDHMTGVENIETIVADDVERILANENKLDHSTIKQLFHIIASSLERSWNQSFQQQRNYEALLARLRSFDPELFDTLIDNWIHRILCASSRPSLVQLSASLICSGCITLEKVLENCKDEQSENRSIGCFDYGGIYLEALDLILSSKKISNTLNSSETYRIRIMQLETRRKFPIAVLSILRSALEMSVSSPISAQKFDQRLCQESTILEIPEVQGLLRTTVLFNTDIFVQTLLLPIFKGSNEAAKAAIHTAIDHLMLSLSFPRPITAELLLKVAGDLSLPFCLVKLTAMFSDGKKIEGPEVFEMFSLAIESAIVDGNMTWTNIISLFDPDIAQYLLHRAEARLMSIFPSSNITDETFLETFQRKVSLGNNLMMMIRAISKNVYATQIHHESNSNLISEIAVALNSLWLLLTNSQSFQVKSSIIESWIPLIFSFILAHIFLFESSEFWPDNRAKVIMALTAIFLELQASDTDYEDIESLIEQSYDLALDMVDTLPDDVRQQCTHKLQDIASNPHISYLYSYIGPSNKRIVVLKDKKIDSEITANPCNEVPPERENPIPFIMRPWEMLGEPTPNAGENDTSISLTLFGSRRG